MAKYAVAMSSGLPALWVSNSLSVSARRCRWLSMTNGRYIGLPPVGTQSLSLVLEVLRDVITQPFGRGFGHRFQPRQPFGNFNRPHLSFHSQPYGILDTLFIVFFFRE